MPLSLRNAAAMVAGGGVFIASIIFVSRRRRKLAIQEASDVIEARMAKMQLKLPPFKPPGGNYIQIH